MKVFEPIPSADDVHLQSKWFSTLGPSITTDLSLLQCGHIERHTSSTIVAQTGRPETIHSTKRRRGKIDAREKAALTAMSDLTNCKQDEDDIFQGDRFIKILKAEDSVEFSMFESKLV